jgi:rod shape-determining protein MreD
LRAVRFLLLILGALAVHFVGVRAVPGFSAVVDPFVVALVFSALDASPFGGLVCGVVIGATQDTVSGGLYGLYGLADTVVGYVAAVVAQRVVIQRWPGVMLAFAAGAALQQLVLVFVAFLVLGDPELPGVAALAIKPAAAAALGLGLFVATQRGRTRLESWRRSRTAKIHFR